MKNFTTSLLASILLVASFLNLKAQDGPGGVGTTGTNGLALWLRADSVVKDASNNVTQLFDLSGNGNHATQSQAFRQPLYSGGSGDLNNQPVIKFDGTDHEMVIPNDSSLNPSTGFTFFTVLVPRFANPSNDALDARGILSKRTDGLASPWSRTSYAFFIWQNRYYSDVNTDGNRLFTNAFISGGTPYMLTSQYNGSAAQHFKAYDKGTWLASGSATTTIPFRNSVTSIGALDANQGALYKRLMMDLAEIVLFGTAIDSAQKIIVENYLGAKYGITVAHNKYAHTATYFHEVAGIGRVNSANLHTNATSGSILNISAPSDLNDGEFLLYGHNSLSTNFITTAGGNVNGLASVKRSSRIWKFDETGGDVGNVVVKVDVSKLPALPTGFSKYGIAVSPSSTFPAGTTDVYELAFTGGNFYETLPLNISDDAYFTIVAINPLVGFISNATIFQVFEPDINTNVPVRLNYITYSPVNVTYNTVNFGTIQATANVDYTAAVNEVLTILPGTRESIIQIPIFNDVIVENSETFRITLSNPSTGVSLSTVIIRTIEIADDDNLRKIRFATPSLTVHEGFGAVQVEVRIDDPQYIDQFNPTTFQFQVTAGTATQGVDYYIGGVATGGIGTGTIPVGQLSTTFTIFVTEDLIDELTETVEVTLSNPTNSNILNAAAGKYTLSITDNDPTPTIGFTTASSSGGENIGTVTLDVIIDAVSGLNIEVAFNVSGGSATAGADKDYVFSPGTLYIPAGSSSASFTFTVVNDLIAEINETIIFSISSPLNAGLGQSTHTFTIIDNDNFGFTGPGGVGNAAVNSVWLKADDIPSPTTAVNLWPDASGNTNNAFQNTASQQPTYDASSVLGSRPAVTFNGTSNYLTISDNDNLDKGTGLSMFSVVRATNIDGTTRAIVSKRPANTTLLYPYAMYFSASLRLTSVFEHQTNNSQTPTNAYSNLTPYIINVDFDGARFGGERVFHHRNSAQMGSGMPSTNDTLSNSTGNLSIGIMNPGATSFFGGLMGELIIYRSTLNSAQRIIIENYLSSKYNIALVANDKYAFDVVGLNYFGNEVAGIGRISIDNLHKDAKGTGLVRIRDASSLDNGEFLLWGHNGAATTTASTGVPTGVQSRILRTWRAAETGGNVGEVTLSFDVSQIPLIPGTEYTLLIAPLASSGNFTGSTVHHTGMNYDALAETVTFTGVDFNHGDYFTLGFKTVANFTWTGVVNTNWFEAGNWSTSQLPTIADNVIIPDVTGASNNFPVVGVSGGLEGNAKNLTVQTGAYVIIATGGVLNVHGDLTLPAAGTPVSFGVGTLILNGSTNQTISGRISVGLLEINNSAGVEAATNSIININEGLNLASGVFLVSGSVNLKSTLTQTAYINDFSIGFTGSISGNVRVERYVANTVGIVFHDISSSIAGSTVGDFSDDFSTSGPNGSQYIPNAACDAAAAGSPYGGMFEYRESASNVNVCNLYGWHVKSAGALTEGRGYAGRISNGTIVDVTGSPNSGNITYSGLTNSGLQTTSGFNLAGNPYQSVIEWADVRAANPWLNGAAYIFVSNGPYTGTYQSYVAALGGVEIAPMQGFLVKITNPGTANINFNNSMRRAGNAPFYKQQSSIKHKLQIVVNGNGFADQTMVAYLDSASVNYDPSYDAPKMFGNPNQPMLYTQIGTDKFSINSLPEIISTPSLDMGFKPGMAGTFAFQFNHITTFPGTSMLYLEDKQTNTMVNLKIDTSYTFTSDPSDPELRFVLHFAPPLETSVTEATCEGNDGSIVFDQQGGTIWDIEISNQGTLIDQQNAFTGNHVVSNLAPGTYTLEVEHASGITSTETIIVGGKTPVSADFTVTDSAIIGTTLNCVNGSTGATAYEWSFGDGNLASVTDPSHAYNQSGNFDIMLIASNADCADTAYYSVLIADTVTSITNDVHATEDEITIFNSSSTVTVQFSKTTTDAAAVNVFNMLGQIVIPAFEIPAGTKTHTLDASDLATGMYMIEVKYGDIKAVKNVLFIE